MRTFVKNGVSRAAIFGVFVLAVVYLNTIEKWFPTDSPQEK
jgi:hypothetical protein